MPPDHGLYPDEKRYSIGRVSWGCIRKCPFCVMKDHNIEYIQPPGEIWRPGTTLRLLDDNILALPAAFREVYEFAVANDVPMRFEYLDARLITDEYAAMLKAMKHDGHIRISFDDTRTEKAIRRGVEAMERAGIAPSHIEVLYYMAGEEAIEDAKYRFGVIREMGCDPLEESHHF